jgi:ligand-binding SRPBCC domain-containing protein
MERFDRRLFEFLLPRAGKVEIVEFTGSKTGDRVHLRFLSPFRIEWISDIVDHGINDDEAFFIDKGIQLPPGISYWRHKHIVRRISENSSLIIDNISYKSNNILLTILIYPILFLSFLPRKKAYQKYFQTATTH